MKVPSRIEQSARARVARCVGQISHSLDMVDKGVPLAAEPDPRRLVARLQAKAQLTEDEARLVAEGVIQPPARAARALGPEKIWGKTADFVGVSFLERGYVSARSVARVAYRNGAPLGSGFMVSDRLFLTNHHVIGNARDAAGLVLEFDYELDVSDHQLNATRFALDPGTFFVTDDENNLDFTLIAVGQRIDGTKELTSFGWCQLSDAADKHALGECANIVQHPDGRYKEVVLRENRLVSRLDTVLHYVADTEPGSSGSPVFNNEWLVIALHHWGGPWRQRKDASGKRVPLEVNEGIRASSIVTELKSRKRGLNAAEQVLLENLLRSGTSRRPPRVNIRESGAASDGAPSFRMQPDGSATWQIPVEISVRVPPWVGGSAPQGSPAPAPAAATADDDSGGEAAAKPNPNYAARKGYNPKFISGHNVPLPGLPPKLAADAAKNHDTEDDDDYELKYLHFSVVMNQRRQLAFFTASNIDGAKAKKVNRSTGKVTPYRPGDGEAMDAEGAEASEVWFHDPRIDAEAQTTQALYDQQKVPGFANPQSKGRMDRMLQRGHLVRRMDPAWGSDQTAIAADADTFHFTNCTPQLGFFNMGSAKSLTLKKSGGGQLWRALEDHVLDNAAADKKRVCCFTGPVLNSKDPKYRTVRVPLKFWKIVVWSQGGKLRSLAMLADQGPVLRKIQKLPEAVGDAEALDELANVKDFLSTVARIEKLTRLDFGAEVRAADIRAGESVNAPVAKPESIPLKRRRRAVGKGPK